MSHLPDDIEVSLDQWETGQRDQARTHWRSLRDRPGTVGRIANRCLELAEQGVEMIRDELGPVPAPDEIGWEDLLMASLDDDDDAGDLDLSTAISALSSDVAPDRPRSEVTAVAVEKPADDEVAPRPIDALEGDASEDYQEDDFFGTPRHDDLIDDDDDDFFDDFLNDAPPVERPTLKTDDRALAAARDQVIEAPSTFTLDDDDDDDVPLLHSHDTRLRDPAPPQSADADAFDDFFASPPSAPAVDDDVYSSGERRAANALTRGEATPPPPAALDAPPSSTTATAAGSGATAAADAFFGDLFDEFGEDIAKPPPSRPRPPTTRDEPEWLGGIEPRPEPPRPEPEHDVSADLDDLREIFGETNRLISDSGLSPVVEDANDPWADVASELTGDARPRPAPSRASEQLDAPRRHTPPPSTSSGASRYAPERDSAGRPAPRRGTQMSFPRLKTPVRAPTPIGRSADSPLHKCQQMLDNGNPFGAYVRALSYKQDGESGLDDFIAAVQEQLLGMAVELIKPLDRCPKLKIPPAAIPSLKHIDARGGYLLSQIDGTISIELLIELGAMPRADAALLLLTLAERDIITLD